MIRSVEDTVNLALQIVYDYDDWGDEHVSEMIATYEDGDPPPCDGDTLMTVCTKAAKLRKEVDTIEYVRDHLTPLVEEMK